MIDDIRSRPQLLRVIGTLAVSAAVFSVGGAQAYQGNMERTIAALQEALHSLREATPDKGGHKATAVNLVQQAIGEVQAGIDFAAERYGD